MLKRTLKIRDQVFSDPKLKPLLDMCKKHKVRVKFSDTDDYSEYDSERRIIKICLKHKKKKRLSYHSIVISLAHEVRHLIQHKRGPYKQYHKVKFHFLTAMAAERDADTFAYKFICKHYKANYPLNGIDFPYITNEFNDLQWLYKYLQFNK